MLLAAVHLDRKKARSILIVYFAITLFRLKCTFSSNSLIFDNFIVLLVAMLRCGMQSVNLAQTQLQLPSNEFQ